MRTLLTNSVKEYAAFLKACTASEVTVEDCSTVTNDDKFRRPPLFAVDLAVEGEGPELLPQLHKCTFRALRKFVRRKPSHASSGSTDLFWSQTQVHPNEDWVERVVMRNLVLVHRTSHEVSFSQCPERP